MDEEELHRALSNRINEVFDNYEDTTADDGWALLREKFPEKKKDRGLAWLWYSAAAIVLLCIGIWLIDQPVKTENMVAKTPRLDIKRDVAPNHPAAITADTIKGQPVDPIAQNNVRPAQLVVNPAVSTKNQGTGTIKNNTQNTPITPTVPSITNNTFAASKNNNTTTVASAINDRKADSLATTNAKYQAMAAAKTTADSASVNKAAKQLTATTPPPAEKASSASAMTKLLAETGKPIDKKAGKGNNRPMISVYAATFFNYAKGSDNQVNVGAGFSSDFKITNKLKLSTGVAIAQNSLNYANNSSSNSGGSYASVSSAANTALTQQYAFSTGVSAVNTAPTLQNYSANLVGLDIPVNLKYEFDPQKSDTYISAGLSSGTFINETYILNYRFAQSTQQSTTHANFSGFDVAKTLNLSFGVGYPLGKSNRLIVEPFLKYPLNGLGSQDIKFGAGGINLKLNFHALKK